jgi:hypothetical protein
VIKNAKLPSGVDVVKVDYDNEESLISALNGQQFLIITLSVRAPPEVHAKIVAAAVKAGVPYIMPNLHGFDSANPLPGKEDIFTKGSKEKVNQVKTLGGTFIILVSGFWYEWSLACGEQWFGFDIKNRKVTFFDDGNTKIDISTWDQCGRALAGFLSLPESGASPAISEWKNKFMYFNSFKVSQRDMLDSIHRVTGSTDRDWEIKYETSEQRYKDGFLELQNGQFTGYAKAMYASVFSLDGFGSFEPRNTISNDLLGLPEDNIDEATKRTIQMVESGWIPIIE